MYSPTSLKSFHPHPCFWFHGDKRKNCESSFCFSILAKFVLPICRFLKPWVKILQIDPKRNVCFLSQSLNVLPVSVCRKTLTNPFFFTRAPVLWSHESVRKIEALVLIFRAFVFSRRLFSVFYWTKKILFLRLNRRSKYVQIGCSWLLERARR